MRCRGDAVVGTVMALEHHGHGGLGLGKEAESKKGSMAVDTREMVRARAQLALIDGPLGFTERWSILGTTVIVEWTCSRDTR